MYNQVDVRLISLLAWIVCKLFFSKITQPFRQKSHECALKLTDLWNTSLQLFDLNYKFELVGASLLALAKSIYYYFWYEKGIEIGSQTSLKTSQRGGYNGTQTLASMVSKISRICLRFKETLGVRRTRKLGDLDLDTGTSFVPTGKLPGSSGENITREGRGVSPSEEQIADCISTVREESSISLLIEEHVFDIAEV